MSAPSEFSVFQALFQAACREYERRTGTTLIEHPLAIQLQTCHSFESLVALLQEQARAFNEFRGSDDKVMVLLNHIWCRCDIQGYQGVVDGGASLDVLVGLFESITNFLHRLDIYIKIPPTAAMTEIVVKIIVELLSTLALVAKHTKQGRLEEIGKNLLEESEVEAVLRRLDRLTQNETRTATAQTLEVVYHLLQNMSVVMEGERISLFSSLILS
ncbi:hypothetical protein BJV78DRAFT_1151337 [Lactifluus subvellereus]|nr:hypothetical protein BJV78DRAFT_1151337 [Lactifluus subvellereus]